MAITTQWPPADSSRLLAKLAYAHFSDRYTDMARTLGFDGHIAWLEAMP